MGVSDRVPRSPAVQLVCVGRLRAPHDQVGADYARRVARLTSFRVDEVPPESLQRGEAHAQAQEAARLRARLARSAWTVGLAPGARPPVSSDQFAVWLERRLAAGRPVAFIIGGASGLEDELLAGCNERMALSTLTMPHQLARVVLAEQLYRALCTLQGHPYPH